MPRKLKSSARRSNRYKTFIVVGIVAVLAVIGGVVFALSQLGTSQPGQPVKVLLQTSMGNITIVLRQDKPITAGNFKNLVEQGKYNGTIFHRVIDGFMIQGGQIEESIPTIPDEIGSNNHNVKGTIAMAKTSQPNSATSQFFINTVDNSNRYATFDTTYTVFGDVISGIDVAVEISSVATDSNGKPLTDVVLIKAEILP